MALQNQGRYMEAAYRYIDAVEKDGTLTEARDRLLAVGDSAVLQAMDDADEVERRGDPVRAAGFYRQVDRMLAASRDVGVRLPIPPDYSAIRRAIFDTAINWQMVQGDAAAEAGRWADAREYYVGARGDYLPSRDQVEESYDAEESLLLEWAEVELVDHRPRSAHIIAQQAMDLRASPARETVLTVRDLQARALEMGTVVIAVPPVMAEDGVREYLGGEFEIELDNVLALDHWNHPPLFVEVADPLILRRELRSLLRGQLVQSPLVVGRALDLIGADLAVMVQLSQIEVLEQDVDRDRHQAIVRRTSSDLLGVRRGDAGQTMDTVTFMTVDGELAYSVVADILLVDTGGRELHRFQAASRRTGPFTRGEFDGDPRRLQLNDRQARYFDPTVFAGQQAVIEGALLEELAGAIAVGTYDQVLAGVR
jgi:hypothetical protein